MPTSSCPQPSAVVFDLGRVLLDFDYGIAATHLAPHAAVSIEDIMQLLLGTPLLHRYECGELGTAQFFEALREATGFKAGFSQFALAFTQIFTPIPAMIQLHSRIRATGVSTVLLSNTNELQFHHIQKHHPFVADFEHHVLSFEHHAMKPDSALYRVVESLTGRTGPEIVFLDDRADNVEAARNLGWRSFVHRNPEDSARHFIELGLLSVP
jgi:HAD superfamily hydrolase (TIGR01509 family)